MACNPATIPLSLEWEYVWRGGGKGIRGGVEMGERRGCLIYWFHSCRCSSLLLSVREGKWSVQAGEKKTTKHSKSHFLSTFSMALLHVCAPSLGLPVSLLPFPWLATCVLCLLQPCKHERSLGLALIGENLRAPPTCGCLFRMPRTPSNLYLLQ